MAKNSTQLAAVILEPLVQAAGNVSWRLLRRGKICRLLMAVNLRRVRLLRLISGVLFDETASHFETAMVSRPAG